MKLRWRQVDYPLVRPLRVGQEVLQERSVIELELEPALAAVGLGEAAPLPGLHRETLDELPALMPRALEILTMHRRTGGLSLRSLGRHDSWRALPPSLRCGLETAALRSVGCSDPGLDPFEASSGAPPPTCVLVDRDLADLDPELATHRCVKVKVGRRAAHLEIAMVQAIRRVLGPKAELRLDANRAFALEAALNFAAEVAPAGPVWIEEPLRDPAELPLFVERSGLPVALDESLHEPERASLAADAGVAAWVLKPALLGIAGTMDFFERAVTSPNQPTCVVSSSFEGRTGLEALRVLAHHAPGLPAPGLGTEDWLGPRDAGEWCEVHA